MDVLGIPGSLRRGSFNRGLLEAAREVAPVGVRVSIFDLHDLPLYDADADAAGPPEAVSALKEAIAAAGALLVATPEYNYSVPGVLKNAIDWASRPAYGSVLIGKPVAIMGASPGGFGTARAQLALRQVFVFTQSPVLPFPHVMVSHARERFDAEGRLEDAEVRLAVRTQLEALVDWASRVGSPG